MTVHTLPPGWRAGQVERRASALVAPSSYSVSARTVDATLATAHRVRRWFGLEELEITQRAANLDRVPAGQIRVLDSHRSDTTDAIAGSLLTTWFADGELRGRIAFADNETGRAAEAAVRDGHLKGLSAGYVVHKIEPAGEADGEPIYRVTDWELLEVSLVSVPADPFAATRSIHEEDHLMPTAPAAVEAASNRAERARVDEIRSLAELAGLPENFAETAIAEGLSVEAFRTRALDERAADAMRRPTSAVAACPTDRPDSVARAIEDVLVARMGGPAPTGPAEDMRGLTLLQLGERLMQARGEAVSWRRRDDVLNGMMQRTAGPSGGWLARSGGMHTTSDFPGLMGNAASRVLGDRFEAMRTPLLQIARKRSATDFRPLTRVQLGEAPELLKVNEHGEVTSGAIAEAAEAFAVDSFARKFGITRQLLINDDLSAFADAVALWAGAAASLEAALLAAILNTNAVAHDGVPLFHANHGNLAAVDSAIDVDSLGDARKALRLQTAPGGSAPIGLAPRFLVVGADRETEAEKAVANLAPSTVAAANPFASRLEVLTEPRLTGGAWFVAADPARSAPLEIGHLDGEERPRVDVKDGWDVLGVEMRCVFDVGAGLGDWRAIFKNGGA